MLSPLFEGGFFHFFRSRKFVLISVKNCRTSDNLIFEHPLKSKIKRSEVMILQAKFPTISFSGQLSNALENKSKQLELKSKHLQALENSRDVALRERERKQKQIEDLFESYIRRTDEGYQKYDKLIATAETGFDSAIQKAKDDYQHSKIEARKAFEEARQKTVDLIDSVNDIAYHAEILSQQSKQNLKQIKKQAAPLRDALGIFSRQTIEETEEVAVSVRQAQQAVKKASKEVQNSLKEAERFEKEEERLLQQWQQEAEDKRTEAKSLWKTLTRQNKTGLHTKLAEIKEARARALDNAKEAYRNQIDKARQVLQEYSDLAEADRQKQYQLSEQLFEMEAAVDRLKTQAIFARASSLPDLARETIKLGNIGEDATGAIIGRILKTLQHSDWLASIRSKLCAIGAAGMFVEYGSKNQQVAMATGMEMKADKIVDSTESPEVLKELKILDREIERLNLIA